MNVSLQVPVQAEVPVADLLARLEAARRLAPFSEVLVDLCAAFSQALFDDPRVRQHPELVSLAYWGRRVELVRLAREFEALSSDRTLLVPSGLAFHVAPGNVDTIFVYSWLLSTLVGNANAVRISSRPSLQTEILCDRLRTTLADPCFAALADATAIFTYGHDAAITDALSARADVRVIWGGDETVRRIRQSPLPPHGRDLTFPDRYSLAALRASAFLAAAELERRALAERFFNDAYLFDQLGCSSPRLVVWVGSEAEVAEAARAFYPAVATVVAARGYHAEAATAVAKLTYAYGHIMDAQASGLDWLSNEVVVLPLTDLGLLDREHCGGGLFLQLGARRLDELVPHVRRKDQTLTHFGFEDGELRALARVLNGRGLDRVVPVGQALAFSRYWDGYDLLQALSRRVVVESGTAGGGIAPGGGRE